MLLDQGSALLSTFCATLTIKKCIIKTTFVNGIELNSGSKYSEIRPNQLNSTQLNLMK